MSPGWITPKWPAPANVRAVCSTREGGVSTAPYDLLNLGDHVGDAPALVATNRKRFEAALGARPVFMKQVHGSSVIELDAGTQDGVEADGAITAARAVACTIMVADCLPVLFTTASGQAVAAAHAGWRGLAGGILEATVAALVKQTQAQAGDVIAWLGPCIGPDAFEVGSEVKAAFESVDSRAGVMFKPYKPGKWLADLPALARLRLASHGITSIHGNDSSAAWCTVTNPSRFFSHRRDRVSGRFASAIWLA
ncbi:peptidoglycan editing factor PgeF [Caenimonas koreensis]|uniref:peptidoglycan editing factor PgeF n=1 Tax=Caenimonas koreensis TaxID=367474 RepID=UPI0037842572